MVFINENFMLNSQVAKDLYQEASKQPIFDYHCHLSPKEIYDDKPYLNIVDLWLAGDHYKWRAMRANGILEKNITGQASNEEKFEAWAKTVENLIGNPLYHWTHLELKRVFDIDENLNAKNWKEIYNKMNDFIVKNELSPRKLIKKANVKFIGTTDKPLDTLEYHIKLKQETNFNTIVSPTFRPDEAFVDHSNFSNFVNELEITTNTKIETVEDFINAMAIRLDYFVEHGCCITDHSFQELIYVASNKDELHYILKKARSQEKISNLEEKKWQTAIFNKLCDLYKERNLVVQVHFGAIRNNNSVQFKKIGVDAGFDSMTDQENLASSLNSLLDSLVKENSLPKMIFYNLNPVHNTLLANTLANFQGNEDGIKSKLQFGAAWWFNDTKFGMIDQLSVLSEQGILSNFVGMLTDSRSFLSYQRHDYFRRILCNYIANGVNNGEIPNDKDLLNTVVRKICFDNAKKYFNYNN